MAANKGVQSFGHPCYVTCSGANRPITPRETVNSST